MIMQYHEDLDTIRKYIRDQHDSIIITDLNLTAPNKICRSNGYKIFWIELEKDDNFFEPEDLHGLRIYTSISNRFKDCKSIVIPTYRFSKDTDDGTIACFNTEYRSNDIYNVYIGNGYINVLVYRQDLHFDDFDYKPGFILVSDGMYHNRKDALEKLLMIASSYD